MLWHNFKFWLSSYNFFSHAVWERLGSEKNLLYKSVGKYERETAV